MAQWTVFADKNVHVFLSAWSKVQNIIAAPPESLKTTDI